MTKLYIAGDSYAAGVGCTDLTQDSFGSVIARSCGYELANLALASANNFIVSLQIRHAVDSGADIVLACSTSPRVLVHPEHKVFDTSLTLKNINYHCYAPYCVFDTNQPHNVVEHPFARDLAYRPLVGSEGTGSLEILLRQRACSSNVESYYQGRRYLCDPETLQRFLAQCRNLHLSALAKQRDLLELVPACLYAKKRGVRVILITNHVDLFSLYLDASDVFQTDWSQCAADCPDPWGLKHVSTEGHAGIASRLLRHYFHG